MRWLSDRSNRARDEIATTSLSASVGLGMRHPSPGPSLWLWWCTEDGAFLDPPEGAHLLRLRRIDHVAMPHLGNVGAGTVEPDNGDHPRDTLTARWQQRPEGEPLVEPVAVGLDQSAFGRVAGEKMRIG